MTIHSWMLYVTLAFIAAATPGPAVLFITTNSLRHGWRKTVFAALGNISGLLCLGIVTITGLGALLKTSVVMYGVIKYLGAGYLMYLGVRMFLRGDYQLGEDALPQDRKRISSCRLFLQAFGVAISNPKAVVFLTALLPQFINIEKSLVPQFSLLILTLMSLSFSCLLFYSVLAHQTRNWITQRGRVKTINRAGGAAFVGFGVLLALSSNK